jgi:hypothetical protein
MKGSASPVEDAKFEKESEMTNWKNLLEIAFEERGESWSDVESNTMVDAEMEKQFDNGYGGSEGCAFTVWTRASVYFPLVYDGAEWVGSVARNPDGKPTEHQGGQ